MNDMRARFLRDKVLTATPAQRVVMLYDRLILDLVMAKGQDEPAAAGAYLGHASQIVAELLGSLDVSAGGPAENLASIYPYLLGELTAVRMSFDVDRLVAVETLVTQLRDAWATIASETVPAAADRPHAAPAWVS
jgi:flagellar protein FliS